MRSNCILRAIWEKVSDWSGTKIEMHKPIKGGVPLPHMIWVKNDIIYDFVPNHNSYKWWRCLWFDGHVRKIGKVKE